MAISKSRKISSWTFIGVIIISIIVFGMFYLGGAVDPAAEIKEPVNTSLLLYWMYIVFALAVVCLLLFGVVQFLGTLKSHPKKALGTLAVVVAFFALLGITYAIGSTEALPGINADSAKFNTPGWLKICDMWIFSIYVLLALSIIGMITGAIKKY